MLKITAAQIIELLSCSFKIVGELPDTPLTPKPINDVNDSAFSFVDKNRLDRIELIKNTTALLTFCPIGSASTLDPHELGTKSFIELENPKIEFAKIVNKLYANKINNSHVNGIDNSATIHPDAKISQNCYIGPNCYIGKSTICDGCILHGNIYIYDDVTIRENVVIHAGTVIGAEGFGYMRFDGEILNFPHIGGVTIEENVEIGSNTCIDRGGLGNTIIQRNVKIDNLVHIAHNVIIEEGAYIVANAMIGGSTRIGKNAYIAPSASLRDVIQIEEGSLVGMGSVVTKNVPSNSTWTGSPARELKEFVAIQSELKKLTTKRNEA
jgi:UDP-3-O-[3-hydroxymyristoyl] glucosamine N-acyltransferase